MGTQGRRNRCVRPYAQALDANPPAPGMRRRRPAAARCASLARIVPLWCAFLIGLALPVARMIHEDTHHHHRIAAPSAPAPPQVCARDGDDDEGTCALCRLLAVAAGLHAIADEGAAIQLPSASISVQPMPLVASAVVSTAAHQPPARGPPAPPLA
jgi:hypothetical protein